MRFNVAEDHVRARRCDRAGIFQHGVRLSHTRGKSAVDFELATRRIRLVRFDFEPRQELFGIGTIVGSTRVVQPS